MDRALAKDPARRPPDAAAFLAELEEAAAERYGATWLTRASVAGLAAAPATAMVVEAATSGGSGAAVIENAAAAVIASQSADADRTPGKKLSRPALAGAGAVLAVVGIVVAIVASGGSDKKASVTTAPLANPQPTASIPPTPAVDPAKASAQARASAAATAGVAESAQLAGRYSIVEVITASTNEADPAGRTFSGNVWTISSCATGPCHVSISSSSGRHYEATFDGATLTFVFSESHRTTCVDSATRQPVPGATFLTTNVVRYRIGVVGLGSSGKPHLAGTAAGTQSYTDPIGDCTLGRPATEARRLTGTRL